MHRVDSYTTESDKTMGTTRLLLFSNENKSLDLRLISFYAFALCLRFESLHLRTDTKVNAKAIAWLMQMHPRRHYITTV